MRYAIILLSVTLAACAGNTQTDDSARYAIIDQYNAMLDSCPGAVQIERFNNVPARCARFSCPPNPGDTLRCIR